MAKGVGCHAGREECIPEDSRRCLLKSWSGVRPTTGWARARILKHHPLPYSSRETAYYYKLAHVRSLEPTSQSAQPAALDAIATALSNSTVFDFDPLFKLDAVVATRSHPLFALLQVFFNGGVDDLHAWQSAHADVSSKFGASPRTFYFPLCARPSRC